MKNKSLRKREAILVKKEEREFIEDYLNRIIKYEDVDYITGENRFEDKSYIDLLIETTNVLGAIIPNLGDGLLFNHNSLERDAEILKGKIKLYLINNTDLRNVDDTHNKPLIFISHSSKDKKYGDAIRTFLLGLGVKDDELIYTSHPLNKIPLNDNIFDYLKRTMGQAMFVIFIWSDNFANSVACMNEAGAAWITSKDYVNLFVPDFNFRNPNFIDSVIDSNKMGIVIEDKKQCRQGLIELSEYIEKTFSFHIDNKRLLSLIDDFIDETYIDKTETSHRVFVSKEEPLNSKDGDIWIKV